MGFVADGEWLADLSWYGLVPHSGGFSEAEGQTKVLSGTKKERNQWGFFAVKGILRLKVLRIELLAGSIVAVSDRVGFALFRLSCCTGS